MYSPIFERMCSAPWFKTRLNWKGILLQSNSLHDIRTKIWQMQPLNCSLILTIQHPWTSWNGLVKETHIQYWIHLKSSLSIVTATWKYPRIGHPCFYLVTTSPSRNFLWSLCSRVCIHLYSKLQTTPTITFHQIKTSPASVPQQSFINAAYTSPVPEVEWTDNHPWRSITVNDLWLYRTSRQSLDHWNPYQHNVPKPIGTYKGH